MQPELFLITSQNKWIPVAKHTMALSFFWQVIFSLVNISEAFANHFSVAGMKLFHSWQQGTSPAVGLACCSVSLQAPRSWKPGEILYYPPIMSYVLTCLLWPSGMLFITVFFPPTCCGPFSEAFRTPLGDNILSREFTVERLTQLQTQLNVAPHLLAKPKFRCKKGCGVLLNAKKQMQLRCGENQHHRLKQDGRGILQGGNSAKEIGYWV